MNFRQMDKDTPDSLRIRKGRLVQASGENVAQYLAKWAADVGATPDTPINIIRRDNLVFLLEQASANQVVFCRFCGQSNQQVKKMVAGAGVYICNNCIDICNEIIADGDKIKVEIEYRMANLEEAASDGNPDLQHPATTASKPKRRQRNKPTKTK